MNAAVVISAVSGTAGVGKTALAVRWAHQVKEQFPDGQLYVNLRGYDPDQPVPPGAALAGFLRALGMPDAEVPLEVEERAAAYRTLLDGRRMLVLLDNAASAEQVRPLLPGSPGCLAVVTSRDSLAGLVARDGAHRIDVDLLPPEDAVALLRALIGERVDAEPEAATALAARCARLPLALRIAAELAASRPTTSLTDLVAELWPPGGARLARFDAGGDPRNRTRDGVLLVAAAPDPPRGAGLPPARPASGTRPRHLRRRGPVRLPAGGGPARSGRPAPRPPDPRHQPRPVRHARPAARVRRPAQRQPRTPTRPSPGCRTPRRRCSRLLDFYLAGAGTAMDTIHPAEKDRRPRPPRAGHTDAGPVRAGGRPALAGCRTRGAGHGHRVRGHARLAHPRHAPGPHPVPGPGGAQHRGPDRARSRSGGRPGLRRPGRGGLRADQPGAGLPPDRPLPRGHRLPAGGAGHLPATRRPGQPGPHPGQPRQRLLQHRQTVGGRRPPATRDRALPGDR